MNPTIRDIRVILTAPRDIHLVVVKVETSEPGLHGVGCASMTTRPRTVAAAIDELKPLLLGRDVHRSEDTWQLAYQDSYWRNSPVLNNAISGIDMALWDIKGKLAGLPLYDLFGGRSREGAAVYHHAHGSEPREVEEMARGFLAEGCMHIRCQLGFYGGGAPAHAPPEGSLAGHYFDPRAYAREVPRLFDHLRSTLGEEVELLHDIHERLHPIDAIRLAAELDRFRLFFLEDPLAPEDCDWFALLRQTTTTPIAMGELFTHPGEWKPLVAARLIDFIRCHLSAIGGITPALKLARLCEAYNVRTAWHGPRDCSPIAHAASLHLEVSCPNFGIHEWMGFSEAEQEVFPGCPEGRRGYLYPNSSPGLGIDIDEAAAARYPLGEHMYGDWAQARLPDGTVARP